MVALVTSVSFATSINGSSYARCIFHNGTKSFVVYLWDSSPIKVGTVVTGSLQESSKIPGSYNAPYSSLRYDYYSPEELQLKYPKLYPFLPLLPKVPSEDEWFSLSKECLQLVQGYPYLSSLQELFEILYTLYSTAPAAKSYHHNYPGGLLQHVYEMLVLYKSLYSVTPFPTDPFIVFFSILCHDYGKLQEYVVSEGAIEVTPSITLLGHPYLSARFVSEFCTQYGLPAQLSEFIQSCVLSHHGNKEWGSPVVPSSPEAFILHELDVLSGFGVQYNQPTGTKLSMFGGTTLYRIEDIVESESKG